MLKSAKLQAINRYGAVGRDSSLKLELPQLPTAYLNLSCGRAREPGPRRHVPH